jgi:DNA-binding SARP family transcriptional activator
LIRFRLLGPLEAVENGEAIALPGGKPRALFGRLLLDPGRVVAAERLVEDLWGEAPPRSAPKVLQGYVSQLRKALGAAAIETRAPGYLVAADPEQVDLARFESLTQSAREASDPAHRAELLHEALALWRGPAFAEFRNEPFADAAGRRLADLRLNALEEKLAAELELGAHSVVVGELEALVQQEPLRERPLRLLMLALYRSGRQAEALAAFRAGRHSLVEQLGIEPTPALQELERAILRHEPALEEPPARVAARSSVVCVGAELVDLVAPLALGEKDLLLVDVPSSASELAACAARLEQARARLEPQGLTVRTACFTSRSRDADLARLAADQNAELLVVGGPEVRKLEASACDVAFAARPDLLFEPAGPVLVPFGGGREEWAALELGAWLARAHGLPLRVLGTNQRGDRRDASRMLAAASLALQRFAATTAEPVLVTPGAEGILSEAGSLLVTSLPASGLDPTRTALVDGTRIPILLVQAGLRPGGLAPEHTLTRFTWSVADA